MEILKQVALSFLNVPYKYGGKNPIAGIDCSGLVSEILRSAGVIPLKGELNAQELFNLLEPTASQNVYGMGSVVFYGESVTKINHVAFCLDSYRMIEAGGGSPLCLTVQDAAHQSAFVKIRLIKCGLNIAAILKPRYAPIGVI